MDDEFMKKVRAAEDSESREAREESEWIAKTRAAQAPVRRQAQERVAKVRGWCSQIANELKNRQVPFEHTFTCRGKELVEVGIFKKRNEWKAVPPITWARGWTVLEKEGVREEDGPYEITHTIRTLEGVLLCNNGSLLDYKFDAHGVHVEHERTFWKPEEKQALLNFQAAEFFRELEFDPSISAYRTNPMFCYQLPKFLRIEDVERGLVDLARRHSLS